MGGKTWAEEYGHLTVAEQIRKETCVRYHQRSYGTLDDIYRVYDFGQCIDPVGGGRWILAAASMTSFTPVQFLRRIKAIAEDFLTGTDPVPEPIPPQRERKGQ